LLYLLSNGALAPKLNLYQVIAALFLVPNLILPKVITATLIFQKLYPGNHCFQSITIPMTLQPRNRNVIADFQQGSYTAVKELYDQNYAELIDFASHLILNKAEAHHIVQETFIKLFLMRGHFDKEPDLKAFLYITVRNICFSYIKAEKDNEPDAEVPWYQQSLQATCRFEDEALRTQALDKMQNQVRALPEKEQTVFAMLFCDQGTIPDVAGQLNLTPVTVTQLRISAIRLLRDELLAAGLFSIPLFIYFVAVYCGEAGY